jgi:hypothetical protein
LIIFSKICGIKDKDLITEIKDVRQIEEYLYHMNYRDFYKSNKSLWKEFYHLIPEGITPKRFEKGAEEEFGEHPQLGRSGAARVAAQHLGANPNEYDNLQEKELLKGMNLEDEACDDGLPKREDGSLDVRHDGRPIHLSKIIQVGAIGHSGTATGEIGGYTNVGVKDRSSGEDLSKDGEGVNIGKDKEPITAGGKPVESNIATSSVGGKVVSGGGQRQGGPNTKGSIAGTPKGSSEDCGDCESEMDAGGVTLDLQEAKSKLRGMIKEALKEIKFDKQSGKWIRLTENVVNMRMGPSYKAPAARQYRTSEDDMARTVEYEPKITEMHDEEEESKMRERYNELINAPRNLSESEMSEMKAVRGKMEKMNLAKQNYGLSQGGVNPNVYESSLDSNKLKKVFGQKGKSTDDSGWKSPKKCSSCGGSIKGPGSLDSDTVCRTCVATRGEDLGPSKGESGFGEHGMDEENTTDMKDDNAHYWSESGGWSSCRKCNIAAGAPGQTEICPVKTSDWREKMHQTYPNVYPKSSKTENTVNMRMGPSWKKQNPQYRTAEQDPARTVEYEPEITEVYDEEEESALQEQYFNLLTKHYILTESETVQLKRLKGRLARINEKKEHAPAPAPATVPAVQTPAPVPTPAVPAAPAPAAATPAATAPVPVTAATPPVVAPAAAVPPATPPVTEDQSDDQDDDQTSAQPAKKKERTGDKSGATSGNSDVRSPTSTSTDVRSPTSTDVRSPTSTDVRSPTSTKTSTDAYTAGNVTVTGGAGSGDTTVKITQVPGNTEDAIKGRNISPEQKRAEMGIDNEGDPSSMDANLGKDGGGDSSMKADLGKESPSSMDAKLGKSDASQARKSNDGQEKKSDIQENDEYDVVHEPEDDRTGKLGTSVLNKSTGKKSTWRGRRQQSDAQQWADMQRSKNVKEYGAPVIEPGVKPEVEPWRKPSPDTPQEPDQPDFPDPLQPDRPGIAPRPRAYAEEGKVSDENERLRQQIHQDLRDQGVERDPEEIPSDEDEEQRERDIAANLPYKGYRGANKRSYKLPKSDSKSPLAKESFDSKGNDPDHFSDEWSKDGKPAKKVSEAGGAAYQHSSYRVQGKPDHGNLPTNPKTRWAHDLDEVKKKELNEIADKAFSTMHDLALMIKRRFPQITSDELRKSIPPLFKTQTGWNAEPESVEKIIGQIESGDIRDQ